MKNLIIILFTFLFLSKSYSQISVNEIRQGETIGMINNGYTHVQLKVFESDPSKCRRFIILTNDLIKNQGTLTREDSVKMDLKKMCKLSCEDMYIISFKNKEYNYISDYKSFTFYGEKTLNEFYETIMLVFDNEDKNYIIHLDETTLYVINKGNKVRFYVDDKYFELTKSQVDKLFNKH